MSQKIDYKPPVLCVVCKKEIKTLDVGETNIQDYDMVDDGIVGTLLAPYGSKHDGSVFQIGICDDCVDKLIAEEKIKLIGDYIFGDGYHD
jgi:hypothetical protein